MSQFLTPFDPTSATTGTLVTNLGQDAGVLLVLNDSAVNLKFTFGDGSTRLSPAQSWRRIDLPSGNPTIAWSQINVLSIPVPTSQVLAEAFVTTESIEEIFPASLVRANAVTGTMIIASEIINNGAAPGTNIVVSSDNNANDGTVLMNNDGSRTIKLNDNGTPTVVESFVNGTGPSTPTPAVASFGSAIDLGIATFNGNGNFKSLQLGGITKFNGINTSGSPGAGGMPVGISGGLVVRHLVNVTTTVNLISVGASSTGLYRVSGYINHTNGTPEKLVFGAQFFDTDLGSLQNAYFWCPMAGVLLNGGQATAQATGLYPVDSFMFEATAGQSINVFFQDPGGTPSDIVSCYVEFLS